MSQSGFTCSPPWSTMKAQPLSHKSAHALHEALIKSVPPGALAFPTNAPLPLSTATQPPRLSTPSAAQSIKAVTQAALYKVHYIEPIIRGLHHHTTGQALDGT